MKECECIKKKKIIMKGTHLCLCKESNLACRYRVEEFLVPSGELMFQLRK